MNKPLPESVQTILNELETRGGTLSETEAAQLSKRSTRRFRYEFSRNVGTTFRTACLMAKLNRGLTLLQTTSLTIPEISAALGYSERSKFDKTFKRIYGVTPTTYRRNAIRVVDNTGLSEIH